MGQTSSSKANNPGFRVVAFAVVLAVIALVLSGCSRCSSQRDQQVVIYTSVDQVYAEPVFKRCEKTTGIHPVAVFDTEETKSTGVVNRLIAEGSHPQADVFWSNDPVRPFLLIRRGLVTPYVSPTASRIPAAFRAQDGTWTGFAARARVLLVNTDKVKSADMPRSIRDLINPRWKGQIAIANPLFGTTTMHVAALFDAWGADKAKKFLRDLKSNGARIASSNGEVKRLVVSGEVAFGLTDTDDAHEALEHRAHVRMVLPDQGKDNLGTLVMPTVAVRIKGGPDPKQGDKFIDCLLGKDIEERMATSAAHVPLGGGVHVPKGVLSLRDIKAMKVDYNHVSQTMETIQPWLRSWVGL